MRSDCLCSKGLRLGGTCLLTHTGARDTHCLISPQRTLESEWWWCSVSVTSNSVTPWAIAHPAPLSMEFSRQECWSGLPFLLQEIFPDQGSKLHLLHWKVDSLPLSHQGSPPWEQHVPVIPIFQMQRDWMTWPRSCDQPGLKPGFWPTSELLTKSLRPDRAQKVTSDPATWLKLECIRWSLLPEGLWECLLRDSGPLRQPPFHSGVTFLPILLLHCGSHWGNPSSG